MTALALALIATLNVPHGSWAGELPLNQPLYFVLNITTAADGSCKASIGFPRASEATAPVTITCTGSQVDLKVAGTAVPFEIVASAQAYALSGTYDANGRSGPVALLPLRASSHADLLPFMGDFTDAAGDAFVFSESLGDLYYFNRRTGRTGRLFPLAPGEFFGGPTWLIYQPTGFMANFSRVKNGRAQSVAVVANGQTLHLNRSDIGTASDIHFPAPDATIAGTLRSPLGKGPFPAVLILAGSNGQPRSGYYAENDFIADQFLRLGFVVLTFDKRGTGESTGATGDNGVENVAAAAFSFLKTQPSVDQHRIGIWGISEGGIIAPKVASLVTGVRFIINCSGAVVDANTQEIERTALMMSTDGFSKQDVADAVALQKLKFHYAQTGDGWADYTAAYDRFKGAPWFPDPYVGPPASRESSAWIFWRESGGTAPAQYWGSFRGPVLLSYGEHELLSDVGENVELFISAMREANNSAYTITRIPGAEHSMLLATTGSMKEEREHTSYALAYFLLLGEWLRLNHLIDRVSEDARV